MDNIMDDDRLLRNFTVFLEIALARCVFVFGNVSQPTWARLAAIVGGETTAGMWRSDDVCVKHVCSGFMAVRFFGDTKMSNGRCASAILTPTLSAWKLEGEISNLVAWKIRRLLQVGSAKTKSSVGWC